MYPKKMLKMLLIGLVAYLVASNLALSKAGVTGRLWRGDSRQNPRSRYLRGACQLQLSAVPRPAVLTLDSSLNLHCKLRGKQRPFASFTWEKDGVQLIASARRQIRTRLRSERLKIEPLRITDAGKYRCVASAAGRKCYSKPVKIFVKGTDGHGNSLQQRSGSGPQERCEPYRGSVCVDNLNSRGEVFMRPNENQDEMEELLRENMKQMVKLVAPECNPAVLRVVCISLFPPCRHVNHTATAMRICKESCLQMRRSYCAKGFPPLRRMKMVPSLLDGRCASLPEIDSNELCARIAPPGNNYKDLLCKRKFRLKPLQPTVPINVLEQVTDSSAICENVLWRSINKCTRHFLKKVFPNVTAVPSGQFAKSTGLNCFHVPLKISSILKSKDEFTKVIGLPKLGEVDFENTIQGFSLKLEDSKMKQLIVPVGYIKEYHLDKMLSMPNVTVYYYQEPGLAKIFGEGSFDLCGTEFKIQVEQIRPGVTLLSGRSPHPVDLSTVELAFGLRQPTNDLVSVVKRFKILKLRLTNPKLNIMWQNENERTMRFSGQSYYHGWGSALVNVEFLLGGDRSFWAAAVTTTNISFKEIFGILAGMQHVRLAKLLDMALSVQKVGFILATQGVKVPKQEALQFQHEPVKTMSSRSIAKGFTLEAQANVKESCKRNDNRSFVCQLVQFAAGIGATTGIQIKSDSNGLVLVLEFNPDGENPDFSIKVLSKLRETWNKIDPFNRIPASNVEITENPDQSWASMPRYHGNIWLRRLEVFVQFVDSGELFDGNIVHITGDIVMYNKRYTYKINNVGLSYCLRILDRITEILRHCKSEL